MVRVLDSVVKQPPLVLTTAVSRAIFSVAPPLSSSPAPSLTVSSDFWAPANVEHVGCVSILVFELHGTVLLGCGKFAFIFNDTPRPTMASGVETFMLPVGGVSNDTVATTCEVPVMLFHFLREHPRVQLLSASNDCMLDAKRGSPLYPAAVSPMYPSSD